MRGYPDHALRAFVFFEPGQGLWWSRQEYLWYLEERARILGGVRGLNL